MSSVSKKNKYIRLDSVRTPDPAQIVFTFSSDLPFFKKYDFFVRYSEPIVDFNEALAGVIFAGVMAPVAQACGASLSIPSLDMDFSLSLKKLSAHWSSTRGWQPLDLRTEQIKSDRCVSGCGILFSGGVDSMATFIQNREKNPRLFVVLGADVPLSKTVFIEGLKRDFYDAFSKQEKAPLTYIDTDVRTTLDEKALSKRFKAGWYADISVGLFLASLVGPVAGLKDLFFSSCSLRHPHGKCAGDPAIIDNIMFAGTTLKLALPDVRRVDKIRKYLAPNPRVHRFVRVCWEQFEKLNCSRCSKCLRTLCELLVNNIDPNEVNFEMTRRTLPQLKARMTGSFYHFFYSETDLVFFRHIQESIRQDEIKNIRGSKEFFEWLRNFSEIRRERPLWYKKTRYYAETLRQKLSGRAREVTQRKFFIIGGYTYSNPGDEAILKTTVSRLNYLYPLSHFIIFSDKEDFSVRFGPGISSECFFYRCPSIYYRYRILQWLYRLMFPLSYGAVRHFARRGEKVVEKMKECDAVLFIGGGYLNSLYNLLQSHFLYRLAKESGQPVYLLGQTMGPFTRSKDRVIASSIFQGARSIVLREESSREELGVLGKKAVVGGDDALAFRDFLKPDDDRDIREYFGRTGKNQVLLGLNLRPAGMPDSFYTKLVEELNRFSRETAGGNLKVIFVPMETSAYCDDRTEAERLDKIENKDFEFSVITKSMTVESRLAAISKTDIFVGMRFHSLIFALSSGVPCLGLYASEYYHRKNWGLLEMYGMERYCLRIDPQLELTGLLSGLFNDRAQIRSILKEKHAATLKNQVELYKSIFST